MSEQGDTYRDQGGEDLTAFGLAIAERRRAIGLSQAALAAMAGISRQNLSLIERGERVPQLTVARNLARVLGVSLDALASSLPERTNAASPVVWWFHQVPNRPVAVVWTWIDGRLVIAPAARLSAPGSATDAIWDPRSQSLTPLPGAPNPQDTLFVAGCDPLLPWLWNRHGQPDRPQLRLFELGSVPALHALTQGWVQVAGSHLWDPERRQFNPLPEPQGQWARIRYLEWETGLVGHPAPEGEVLWVIREPGSAARALLERHWQSESPQPASRVEVTSHLAVAQIVERNPQAQGVSLGLWAHWYGIPFTRWAVEPFEWITRRRWVEGEDERVAQFCHWLASPWVRQALGRYPAVHPNAPGSVIGPAS